MNRVMTDMGSALAPVVGKIRVRASIPTRWILPGHLHLRKRVGKRTVLGQLLVCVPLPRKPSTVTDTTLQPQRCPHDIQIGLEPPSIPSRICHQVCLTLSLRRFKLKLTFGNTQRAFELLRQHRDGDHHKQIRSRHGARGYDTPARGVERCLL